jgi:excisionase family DNA binding protein
MMPVKAANARTWLTLSEAAEHCRVSRNTFRSRVTEGRLPAPACLGRRRLWELTALDRALAADAGEPGEPLAAESPEEAQEAQDALLRAIQAQLAPAPKTPRKRGSRFR